MAAWRDEISLLVLKKYFTSERSERVKHSKRNFVSPRGHVISSMYSNVKILSRVNPVL